jgi:hypothetical protein
VWEGSQPNETMKEGFSKQSPPLQFGQPKALSYNAPISRHIYTYVKWWSAFVGGHRLKDKQNYLHKFLLFKSTIPWELLCFSRTYICIHESCIQMINNYEGAKMIIQLKLTLHDISHVICT